MYCSIDEAWPKKIDHLKDKNPNNDLICNNKTEEPVKMSSDLYEEFKNFMNLKKKETYIEEFAEQNPARAELGKINNHNNNNNNNHNNHNNHYEYNNEHKKHNIHFNCDDYFEHINNCDICMKKVYKNFNCLGKNNGLEFLSMLNINENKQVISVVLMGVLVILILQLFKTQ